MTTKTPTIDELKKNVETINSSISSAVADLEKLRAEHADLEEKWRAGTPGVDVDRLGELGETLIPRREKYLEQLQKDTLPRAEHAVRQAELDHLAEDGRGGIAASRRKYETTIATAEKKLAEAVASIREAGEEWNAFLAPATLAAEEASEHRREFDLEDDPAVRHLSMGWGRNLQSRGIAVHGTEYTPVNVNGDLRQAVRQADSYLAGLVAEANNARVVTEGQRVQSLDRRA